jgi:hypothetical protein
MGTAERTDAVAIATEPQPHHRKLLVTSSTRKAWCGTSVAVAVNLIQLLLRSIHGNRVRRIKPF